MSTRTDVPRRAGDGAIAAAQSAPGDAAGSALLEAQVRECYGRVVYSHKTHEKCADRAQRRLARIKLAQITLSALTTSGLLLVVFGPADKSKAAAVVTAVISLALFALNAYTKEYDLGQTAQQHKDAADRLWGVRESYLSLLTDLRGGALGPDAARVRRDALQEALAAAYKGAPRTDAKGYAAAQRALKASEDLTFSDAEIDAFLPRPLRKAT